jgi:hypothetical protein
LSVAEVQVNSEDLLHNLEHDSRFWLNFLLAEQLELPVPDFHEIGFKHLVNMTVSRIALAWPRGFAKTTIAKCAAVWHWVFSRVRFILYISSTSPLAKLACVDIVEMLEGENFERVFGKVLWERRSETEGLYIFKIGDKRCILRALGADQKVRGLNVNNQRPQLGIVDDLEDNDNTETEDQRRKLRNWVYGPFFKCFDRIWHKLIWLGNMLSNFGLLKEHCEDPNWNSMRFGCLVQDEEGNLYPLWPEFMNYEAIQRDFLDHQKKGLLGLWYAEMMNLPTSGSNGLINIEQIEFRPQLTPGDCEYGFITVDPAISQKTWANETAIAGHGYFQGKWQIVDYIKMKMTPEQLYRFSVGMALKWGFQVIGVESQAYQASLEFLFEMMNTVHQIQNIEYLPLLAGARKHERIAAWCSLLKEHVYTLTEGDFTICNELIEFDPLKKENRDDLIDACAHGEQVVHNHLGLVMMKRNAPNLNNAVREHQLCAF